MLYDEASDLLTWTSLSIITTCSAVCCGTMSCYALLCFFIFDTMPIAFGNDIYLYTHLTKTSSYTAHTQDDTHYFTQTHHTTTQSIPFIHYILLYN